MKRKTLLLLFSLLFGVHFAAVADGLWGAKASLDFNVPGKWHAGEMSFKNYNSGLGFSVGGVYSHYFNDYFFVEPSLSLFYDTYSEEVIIDERPTQEKDPLVYKAGLRLPVVVGYTFDLTDTFAISVFTGPELDYAFAGGYRVKNKKALDIDDWSLFRKESGHKRFTCSWKGGLGFPFTDWRIDVEAVIGLTDMINGPASCKENRFSVSLLRYF